MNSKTFYEEVSRLLACDHGRAEAAVTVVFHELSQRLTGNEVAHVAAQLPHDLRLLWAEDQNEPRPPHVHRPEFIGRVRRRGALASDDEAERAVRAVFRTLQRALGSVTGKDGEAADIWAQLPRDLASLWLEAAQGGSDNVVA